MHAYQLPNMHPVLAASASANFISKTITTTSISAMCHFKLISFLADGLIPAAQVRNIIVGRLYCFVKSVRVKVNVRVKR